MLAPMSEGRWWVFKRPVLHDRLFVAGLVVGCGVLVATTLKLTEMGWLAAAASLFLALPGGLLAVGIVGGTVREYRSGRRARP